MARWGSLLSVKEFVSARRIGRRVDGMQERRGKAMVANRRGSRALDGFPTTTKARRRSPVESEYIGVPATGAGPPQPTHSRESGPRSSSDAACSFARIAPGRCCRP
jgi:hypothetical protein